MDLQKELELDFEALERVENIVKNSTFRGAGAPIVVAALELLVEMKRQKIKSMKGDEDGEGTSESEAGSDDE